MNDINQYALDLHKKFKGKITLSLRDTPTKESLAAYYTPGVGGVSSYIAEHPEHLRDYTWTNNLVAVISDGSAVLGLGDIGPQGAMPVMEGKAMLFKHFANIDAVPIALDVHTPEEIIATVKAIAPSFGGINLEDIAAPQCFEIEATLKKELDIPVMHDDQHGTAVVVLAGIINSLKITSRSLADLRIVIAGAGAAGVAIAKLLWQYGATNILMVDSQGIIGPGREQLTTVKQELLAFNKDGVDGSLQTALKNAHIFVGVSKANLLSAADVENMANDAIVFALSNPIPEIMPDVAHRAGALIVATGRSDFPNQVNNALAFPGIFRGALDNGVTMITDEHKIKAAEAIAALVVKPTPEEIIPSVFNKDLVENIAATITH